MNFTDYKCDGCGKQFEAGDDIVSCPVCGTPQHRECYEQNGGCINEKKHADGFEWTAPKIERPEETVHKPTANDSVSRSLNAGELPDVDDVIEQRINAICPGITEQQREEPLCGSDIGKVSAFVGNGAKNYIKKFRIKERNRKNTFNWVAFLFSPYWFFWRKLYKPGILLATLEICFSLLSAYFLSPVTAFVSEVQANTYSELVQAFSALSEADLQNIYSHAFPVVILQIVLFMTHLFAGFFADRMYHAYCEKKLAQFERIKLKTGNEESLKFYLSASSTSFMFTLISIIAVDLIPELVMRLMEML